MELKQITGTTQLTGLLGSPVSHSISPMMHNDSYQKLKLDYVYLAFDVGTEQLQTVVEGLRAMNVRGFNCTMPNKSRMCELVDELSGEAALSGAVNTVVHERGLLKGYNTDGAGFMRALRDHGIDVRGQKVTILGGGGAAAAICAQAAIELVGELAVFIRHHDGRHEPQFVRNLRVQTQCHVKVCSLEESDALQESISSSQILINATSVGMSPNEEGCLISDADLLVSRPFVADVIYQPGKTRLLSIAEEADCRTMNGLDMLLYQGAAAFQLWTGQDMPVDWIRDRYFRQ